VKGESLRTLLFGKYPRLDQHAAAFNGSMWIKLPTLRRNFKGGDINGIV